MTGTVNVIDGGLLPTVERAPQSNRTPGRSLPRRRLAHTWGTSLWWG